MDRNSRSSGFVGIKKKVAFHAKALDLKAVIANQAYVNIEQRQNNLLKQDSS